MSLQNPTVILCTHCSKIMRDERSTPNALYTMRYDECATCRAKLRTHIDELRTGVEFTPLVKTDRPPSLPSSQAAASPVPDSSLAEAAYQAYMGTPHKGLPRWEGEVPPLSSEDTHPDERRAWINAARAVRDALQAAPRDGIRIADDDGENLVFDVHLVMTARTATEDGARYWHGATRFVCGDSKTCASLDYRGNLHDYGLGKQMVDAIEDALAARQPRKGDE